MKRIVTLCALIIGIGALFGRPAPLYPPPPTSCFDEFGYPKTTDPYNADTGSGYNPNDLGPNGIVRPLPVTWTGEVVPEYIDVLTADATIKNGVTQIDVSGHIKGKPYKQYMVKVFAIPYANGPSTLIMTIEVECDENGNGSFMEYDDENVPALAFNQNAYEIWAQLFDAGGTQLYMGCGVYAPLQQLP